MKTQEITTSQKKSAKKSGKVLNTVVNVFLVVVIIFGAFCAFNAFMAKKGNTVPSLFGLKFASIQSDSMTPTFNKGDLIVDVTVKDPSKLKKNSSADAKDGDVITFWTTINGEIVLNTHRIVDIVDNETYLSFITRGDNPEINRNDSVQVHQSAVEGRFLFAIPKLGSFVDFLETSKGFLIVVVIPAALLFIWQLIQFFRSLFAYQAEKVRLQMQMQMQGGQQNAGGESAAPLDQAASAPDANNDPDQQKE